MALGREHFRIIGALHLYGPATIPALAQRLGLSTTIVELRCRGLRDRGFLLDDCGRGDLKQYTVLWHRVQTHYELARPVKQIIRRHRRRERLTDILSSVSRRTSVRI